ncbi:Alpha-ketoglutaric semialdehyde dehydrogenase [bacterium HR40]|nr:Alpha-ketoglutaric semialdehyde dehydrogenase [bacterium HR40]
MTGIHRVQLLIGGEWREAASGATLTILDPATEEPVTIAPQAGREDTQRAIEAAHAAFASWRRTPPWERSRLLREAARLLATRSEEVARQLTLEVGKPIAQSRAEVQAAVECIDWYADEARRIYGESLPGRAPGQRFETQYEPVGVVAAFTAWNFPVVLQARKIAPALAAGCTVVCRPAEEGTGAVALLVRCFLDAGLPAGVVNMLTGLPQEISETVMDSELVRKVSFTGSIPVGQYLIRRSADTVKRISMELGGHAPVIVHEDVDVEQVAKASVAGKFRNAGQVCVSPTRFFVHRRLKDAFVAHFVAEARKLRLGHGLDPATDVGPLINRRRLAFIEKLVDDTRRDGACLVLGGGRPAGMNRGFFFEPTVFDDVPDEARAMREEPFGPIALISPFDSFEEAIARANALPYGLAAYTFTNSLRLARRTIDALETGIVGVNTFVAATAEMPFGGVKHSGFGRENGRQGILDYLNVKFANIVM